jgi:bifunctional non-homologous end joining protein LigD
MALEKYKAKRDFTKSPEPAGTRVAKSPSGRTPRFFCVQKHLASHLHYDFRIEHNGVLLSWAVPKGPSLDPSIKRLAMHVEDHPIDYGEFEGVIPSGYGAGIVMLWDKGTWTPEVDDVDAALKKGDLKFTLDGYKLKGSWVLVRTKGRYAGGGESGEPWLLIKHRDDWSGPVDIAEFAPLSVKSEGDFADILSQDDPDVWRSNRPAKGGETGAMFERIVKRALELRATPTVVATPAKTGATRVKTSATPATRAAAAKSVAKPRAAKSAVEPRAAAKKTKPASSATRGKKR